MSELVGKQNIERTNLHNAPDWPEQLTAYLDGELEVAANKTVADHLITCAACQAEVKAHQTLVAQLSQLSQLAVPHSFAITPAKARQLNPRPLYTAVRVALAVAAALLIFIFALDFLGLANNTTLTEVAVQPAATATPDFSLPPIGTRPACAPASGQGNVICQDGESGNSSYTATPQPVAKTIVTTTAPSVTIRIAEIGLVLLVFALAAFALAVRPRAPAKIRF